jgi:hypothetical protein
LSEEEVYKTISERCNYHAGWSANSIIQSWFSRRILQKAFESVSWFFLLEVLQHAGFSRRWTNWIALLLSSASARILLNGRPGQHICHSRGQRQGDPLSPMLFVLSIEVLNALITRAENDCLFWPIGHDGIALRASFYSNHMVIFIKSARQEMLLLLAILDAFEQASRLKTNLEKKIRPSQLNVQQRASNSP